MIQAWPFLNENEERFLTHWSRWGSAGYPVSKVKRGWIWHEAFGIKGPPVVYKTKKKAIEAIENYIDILCDKKAGRL